MRRFIIFLPWLMALTACSNTATIKPSINTEQPPTTTTDTPPVEAPASEKTVETPQESDTTTNVEQQPVYTDIWQRMRQDYQLPELNSPLVNRYERWNRQHSRYVEKMLQRGHKYLFHIVEQIEQRDMPMEIALLPAIESAYRAKAKSRSHASGLWQFIPATGRYLGMRQDWWVDQRRDILISTSAALDYLQSLHQEFDGDWLLALAAYNGGKGTIAKAIKHNRRSNKPSQLEHLKLRRETTHYVPKLIALSRVIMNPEHYGITLPKIANQPYFTVENLPGQIDLIKVVKNTSLSRQDIDDLNPLFLRWASDPKGPHRLIVPIKHQSSVAQYLATTPSLGKLNWREHTIKSGDTMSHIARQYAVSTTAIRHINGMKNNKLRAGKTILIPLQTSSAPHAKQRSKTSYQVKKGDTLWGIARRYDVSVADLAAWNNISQTQTLALNQVLKLPRY